MSKYFPQGSSSKPKLLDELHMIMRRKYYSIHTERSYADWVKRFVHFHQVKERRELLLDRDRKVEDFLTHLAVAGRVAPATQNQALNALVFLYRQVLEAPLGDNIRAERARKKARVPVVFSRDEVTPLSASVVPLLENQLEKVKVIHQTDLGQGCADW